MKKSLVLGLGMAAINPAIAATGERPNILWIIADDLGTDLACYGNKSVKTPNTDRLASEGITFTGLHSVTAVSSPSRSALITGMYPVSIDCNQHRTLKKKPLPEGVNPVTDYFHKSGYWVCNGDGTRPGRAGKTDYNFEFQAKTLFDGPDWSGRKAGQPFFAQMQIHFPHRPFEKDSANPVNRENVFIPPVYPDHPLTREDWAQYLESVQHVDDYVGRIMERLEKDGLLDNTIVFFFGDQGRPMVRAKQFVYDEGTNTPFIIRFPDKKMAGQRSSQLVTNIDIPATSLILAGIPLPAKMQGKDIFAKKKREYVFTTRDRMDETVDRIRAVRSNRFKYIRNYYPERPYTQFNSYKTTMYPVLTLMEVLYKNGQLTPEQAQFMGPDREAVELYDLEKDPFEIKNLATDPAYSSEMKRLGKELDRWVGENDLGKYPEDKAATDYWKAESEKSYQQKMKSYGLSPEISDEDFVSWWMDRFSIKPEGESFTFAFMTDIHLEYGNTAIEDFRRAADKLNSLKPDFLLTGGDNIRDARRGRESYADSLYNLYKSEIRNLKMPVYSGFGNHESFGVDNPPALPRSQAYGKNMYRQKIGPTYYSFVHKGWKFFMLDNVFDTLSGRYRYIGRIDDAQMKWIEKELASTDKEMPVVICSHIPFVSSMKKFELGSLSGNPVNDGVENSTEFFKLFRNHNIKLVLQGHFHFFEVLYANDAYYITGPSPNKRFGNPTSKKYGMFLFTAGNDNLTWKFIEN